MTVKEIIAIFGCVFFMGLAIYYLVTVDSKNKKAHDMVPKEVKEKLLFTYPNSISYEELKHVYRFNLKKIILLNIILVVIYIFIIIKRNLQGGQYDVIEYGKFILGFIAMLNVIAISIDLIKWIRVFMIKEKLYEVPVYLHDLFYGYAYISYHDVSSNSVITKRVCVGRACRFGNKALMKIDGDKYKFIRIL